MLRLVIDLAVRPAGVGPPAYSSDFDLSTAAFSQDGLV